MPRTKVNQLVSDLVGSSEGDRVHVQTVKITEQAHARLRALADFAKHSKTSLAADLLMAAIDDAIDALPTERMDEAAADKLRGITKKWKTEPSQLKEMGLDIDIEHIEPRSLRDIVLERAEHYIAHDNFEFWNEQDRVAAVASNGSSSNGVAN